MTADRPRTRCGRPRVDPTDATVELALSIPSRVYTRALERARATRTTVPAVLRHILQTSLAPRVDGRHSTVSTSPPAVKEGRR